MNVLNLPAGKSPAAGSSTEGQPGLWRCILVAHDLTSSAAPVFFGALAVARWSGARLFLVHVDDPLRVNAISYIPASCYDSWVQGRSEYVHKQCEPLVAKAREVGVETQVLALVGSLVAELLNAARRYAADLIVIGFHHRSGLARFFPDRTAKAVAKVTHCPMLIVPISVDE